MTSLLLLPLGQANRLELKRELELLLGSQSTEDRRSLDQSRQPVYCTHYPAHRRVIGVLALPLSLSTLKEFRKNSARIKDCNIGMRPDKTNFEGWLCKTERAVTHVTTVEMRWSLLLLLYPHPCSCLNAFITPSSLTLMQKFMRLLCEQARRSERTRLTLSAALSFTTQSLLCWVFRRPVFSKPKPCSRPETWVTSLPHHRIKS